MPEAYEKWLVPTVFRPFASDLAHRVAARAPEHLLELAAGTGVLTRELAAAIGSAEVTATDLNDAMVEFGRTRVPGATWRQADAMHIPFDDAPLRPGRLPVRGDVLPGQAGGVHRDPAGA